MSSRRTIAVCVTGYDWEYESRVVNGIYERCQQLDINLLVFATLLRKPELNSDRVLPESIVRGELEIFNLMNLDLIDGIVILGESLISGDAVFEIERRARERGIPAVNVNDPDKKLYRNIILSDSIAMEFVMTHLVEDHKLTRIAFIGGFPGNLQTEERLSAYRKVLTAHGITVNEDWITYGEFWTKSTECTEKIMTSGDIPQAIVCASDAMAIFCMDWLKAHGYRIPEDIIVTGFDAIKDSELYRPSITTVRRAFGEAGTAAVDLIHDIWNGKDTPETLYVNSVLVPRQSCGCLPPDNGDIADFHSSRYNELNRTKEFHTYMIEMNTHFSSAKTSEELYSKAKRGAEFFSLNRLYICVGRDIESRHHSFDNDSGEYEGISDTMTSMLQYGHEIPIGTEFPTAQLLPEPFLNGEKPVFFAFSPLYFRNTFIGYLAYEPSKIQGLGELFGTWSMGISNNAGSFYTNSELQYVIGRLDNLNIRDPLTGLYNRRGMDRLGKQLLSEAKAAGQIITVICADIDHLKPINDVYGHEAGDNAILQTAHALMNAMPEHSACVRTGGDEYTIIIRHDSGVSIESFIDKVDDYLTEYNGGSSLPYSVGCSCGYCSAQAGELKDLEELSRLADDSMYKIKMAKKAAR